MSVEVTDRKTAAIALGYDSVDGYEQDKSYFGAMIGRNGKQIAGSQFTLDGTVFHLPCGFLSGNPAFSRFTEPFEFSADSIEAGTGLSIDNNPWVFNSELGNPTIPELRPNDALEVEK